MSAARIAENDGEGWFTAEYVVYSASADEEVPVALHEGDLLRLYL